jgi:hypothetical protein
MNRCENQDRATTVTPQMVKERKEKVKERLNHIKFSKEHFLAANVYNELASNLVNCH